MSTLILIGLILLVVALGRSSVRRSQDTLPSPHSDRLWADFEAAERGERR